MYNEELKQMIPADFSDNARVWIYQSSRPFSEKEQKEINEQLYHFYAQWLSHGEPVKGWAGLLFNRFIVIMADETDTHVSGCSTDSSVRIIKSLEKQYSINLFDRMSITFLVKGQPEMLPYGQVQYAIDKGYLDENTLTFNNIIGTKKELMEKWMVPLKQSWLGDRVNFHQTQP
ncbi:hypothetical protein ACTHGU_06415 [Chitinophagaceae bacterium MMS25-I14]